MELYGDFLTTLSKSLNEIDRNWKKYPGVVIGGSHSPKKIEVPVFLDIIKDCRISGRPYLGICYGHQLAAIEYARNVKDIWDATSEEFGNGTFVVKKRQSLKVGLHNGENYWNNYEVDLPGWVNPPNFFTTQAHPEYQSSIDRPHPFLVEFLLYAKRKTKLAM